MGDYRDFDFDVEGQDDIIRMEIESEYEAYLRASMRHRLRMSGLRKFSDMYVELDMKDCE